MKIKITHIDTACIIININGFRILTDPVFDRAGKLYHFGYGTISRKTDDPAIASENVGKVDLVLFSHHQHQDNLDITGKNFIKTVEKVVSTTAAARVINNVIGLNEWQTISIDTEKVPGLAITAVPARHHPWWLPGFFAGKVIGFIIEFDGQENGVIYISGDTVYFKGIDEIARRFKIDLAILHLGAVQFRYLTGWGEYTFSAKDAIKTALQIQARKIVPIHFKGWTHFKEGFSQAKNMFDASPIKHRTIWLTPGGETTVE